jgi:hypothetical protein
VIPVARKVWQHTAFPPFPVQAAGESALEALDEQGAARLLGVGQGARPERDGAGLGGEILLAGVGEFRAGPRRQGRAEQAGRQLGALIAKDLVADIQAMGLSAVEAAPGSSPQVGDGVIRGYLVSVEGGSSVKRFAIGFGSGTSEMDTVVEGYLMTPQGLRRLGSGTLSSSGGKTPGIFVPAAVAIASGNPIGLIVVGGMKIYGEASGKNKLEGRARATADAIAKELKIRFQDRGWIAGENWERTMPPTQLQRSSK